MTRIISILLCLCFALGGCAQPEAPQPVVVDPQPVVVEPSKPVNPQPADKAVFEKLALGLAAMPELPEQPSESELWDALDALDYEKLGSIKYEAEQRRLWDEYNAKQDAYRSAVSALRGDGLDLSLTQAFDAYTRKTAGALLSDAADKNVVYSPVNLYLALCMLAETADGNSRAQLLDLLGLKSVEQAREAANELFRSLYTDSASGKTLLANSIWMNERFDYHQETIDNLTGKHFASAFRAAMGDKATDAAIASWINANTNNLLADAAGALETDPDTLLMLVSTLYFKGTWVDQFSDSATREDTFTAADGTKQKLDFMHTTENGTYYRGKNCTVASLPFHDGTSMWFLLPDEGVSVSDALSAGILSGGSAAGETPFGITNAKQGNADIVWSVPKFDVDNSLDLIPALQSLGVTDVFTGAADFTPLTDLDAFISAVTHAARVKVDEEGCEAAAFTVISMECTSAMPVEHPKIEMNLNRPFAFLITGADGLPLFLSVVNTME